MSDISAFLRVQHLKAPFSSFEHMAPVAIEQLGKGVFEDSPIIGTTEEDIDLGSIVTVGFAVLMCLDEDNFVTYGPKDGSGNMTAFGRLRPGDPPSFVRLEPGLIIRAVADTAPAQIFVRVYEA